MEKFERGFQLIRESLFDKGATSCCTDNIITWNKSYSFLRDDFFLGILNDENTKSIYKSIIWRIYILLYFSEIASKADGDYIEVGCYEGFTPLQIIKKLTFSNLNKRYFLYDLFQWGEGDRHDHLEGHNNPNMLEDVKKLFSGFDFVQIIKGYVPESFSLGFPDKIAFAHLDMGHQEADPAALKILLPKLSKGGVVIINDYGWWGYSAHKNAYDRTIKENGLSVLELPTGQGLLIRP